MNKIQELKNLLKEKAEQIKSARITCKNCQRGVTPYDYGNIGQSGLVKLARDYRHHHIAYCELRGTPREVIEQPRENNEPCESSITAIKERYSVLVTA